MNVIQDHLDMVVAERANPANREWLERLFGLVPTLPEVPLRVLKLDSAAYAQAMTNRAQDEVHVCALCGGRARIAIIVDRSPINPVARWLDVCPRCSSDLRSHGLDFDDSEIMSLYRLWTARVA